MPNNRDDFSKKTKDRLAKRVGCRCSNPNCRKLTCGASQKPDGYVNIGVAAHICAAAPGGKRYNHNMTSEERSSIINGIWLCQSCSKLIDSDELRYTEELLHQWKYNAETETFKQLADVSSDERTRYNTYRTLDLQTDDNAFVQLQNILNREINQLMTMMELIHQKLDAAKMEGDGFLVWAYEERQQTLMASYVSMNERLRKLAGESRNMGFRENVSPPMKFGDEDEAYVFYDKYQPSGIGCILRLLASLIVIVVMIPVFPIIYVVRLVIKAIRSKREKKKTVEAKSKLNRDSHVENMIFEIQAVREGIDHLASEVDALHLDRIQYERAMVDAARKTTLEK